MLTLTLNAKIKWLLGGHSELNQKYGNFNMLIASIGFCLFTQLPASVYCIPSSKLLVKKKIGGSLVQNFDIIKPARESRIREEGAYEMEIMFK